MQAKHEIVKKSGERKPILGDSFIDFFGMTGPLSRFFGGTGPWAPSIDVEETDKEYKVTADLPGMEKNDINVEIRNGALAIRGERKSEREEKGKSFLRREHAYGSYFRSLSLPGDAKASAVKAAYKDGILTVNIPRAEGAKPRSLKVEVK